MLRVALTGGAGSGKSVAAAMFRELGAFVSQSDEIGRAMMQPGEPVFFEIVKHFGPAVLAHDGCLDRRILAKIAFVDGRVDELNSIVHPAVIAAQGAWMRHVAGEHAGAVAIVESALVLETKYGDESRPGASAAAPWRTRFDRIVLITALENVRLDRVIARASAKDPAADRDGLRSDARARFAAQMPEEQKAELADVVLRNDGTIESLREKVSSLYDRLLAESRDQVGGAM